jgi:hypothetical protein
MVDSITNTSVMMVITLTLCNWIAATLPFITFKSKPDLTSGTATCIVAWHVFCIIYGLIVTSLMALPTIQTVQCCIASIDKMEGFTSDINFQCSHFSCNYYRTFTIIPFISIIWSTFSVQFQIHNIFRYLHDRQQEAGSYDRLIQRLTAAQQDGGGLGNDLNFDMDGIILAHETKL